MDFTGKEEYFEALDKRTKEYKESGYAEWKAAKEAEIQEQPSGLGDVVEKVTKATGIKAAVKAVLGDDCGCDERKAKLNKLMPLPVHECATEKDYIWLKEFFERRPTRIKADEQRELIRIYNYVFKSNRKFSTCGSCVKAVYKRLERYIDAK